MAGVCRLGGRQRPHQAASGPRGRTRTGGRDCDLTRRYRRARKTATVSPPAGRCARKADEQLSDIESQVETLRQQKDRQAKEEKRLRGLPDELKQAQAERAARQTELAALDRQRADLTAQRDTLTRELVKNFVAARTGQEWEDNGLQMKFCWCPPGTFTMGSPASEAGYDSDEDQVSVTISNGLWMGKYEVLQGEYRTVMGNTPSHFSSSDRRPVETVSYTEATEFCRKFTEQERRAGRLPADWEYRLPTEAEWEYACRAGTTTRFCCGDSESELENYAWFSSNSGSATHPVGEKQPNAWGLHDMHGNVWEWCQDWYQDKLPGGGDPVGPQSASVRVTRGGSWYVAAGSCRSAYRRRYSPEFPVVLPGLSRGRSPVSPLSPASHGRTRPEAEGSRSRERRPRRRRAEPRRCEPEWTAERPAFLENGVGSARGQLKS